MYAAEHTVTANEPVLQCTPRKDQRSFKSSHTLSSVRRHAPGTCPPAAHSHSAWNCLGPQQSIVFPVVNIADIWRHRARRARALNEVREADDEAVLGVVIFARLLAKATTPFCDVDDPGRCPRRVLMNQRVADKERKIGQSPVYSLGTDSRTR